MTSAMKSELMHPEFESLVQQIIQSVDKQQLAELRKDFHNRLRITLTQPEAADLIEDLWDFFYDWCVFDQNLPDDAKGVQNDEKEKWNQVKGASQRGLYTVQKVMESGVKLKELFSGNSCVLLKTSDRDFIGIERGDIIEGRLIPELSEKGGFRLARRPSYHPSEVHDYIKKKVKQFRKAKDFDMYQNWLWLLVGMYLKHRIYAQMPIDKIYDDNSRI